MDTGEVTFYGGNSWRPLWSLHFPENTFEPIRFPSWSWLSESVFKEAQTPTPSVPGILRQKNPEGVILLFEVSRWEEMIQPNLDPYLLRHVVGNVYAVLGTWNITDLEAEAFRAARDLGL